jgi:hypothetical protein
LLCEAANLDRRCVSRAKDKKTLSDAIDLVAEYDRKIIVEKK